MIRIASPRRVGLALAMLERIPAPAQLRWTASGTDALESLGFAVAAVELADGRVAVLDAMSDEIHVLARDGTVDARWGGSGEGPEQFQVATGMFVVGDSLFVVDHGGARASHVAPDGKVTRLLSTTQGPGAGVSLVTRLPSGEWIGTRSEERTAATEGVVDTLLASVLVLDATGAPTDSVGRYVERLALLRSTPQMVTMVKLPYSPRGSVRAAGSWLAYHTGLEYGVTLVDRSTGERRVFQFDSVPPRLAAEGRTGIVNAALEQVLAQQRPMMAQLWQRTPWPEQEGGLIGAYPTRSGSVWIGVVDAPAAAVGGADGREHWVHVDPRGYFGQAFTLGPREQLLSFTDSSAIVLARDVDGVQSIRAFTLAPVP
jgi:hypothetical protein